MAISTETAANIVYGSDKMLHIKIRGAMLKLARDVRDDPANEDEVRQKWARQVMAGNDSSYAPVLRELSLRQAIQDGYTADNHTEQQVKTNVNAVLDDAIAAQLG